MSAACVTSDLYDPLHASLSAPQLILSSTEHRMQQNNPAILPTTELCPTSTQLLLDRTCQQHTTECGGHSEDSASDGDPQTDCHTHDELEHACSSEMLAVYDKFFPELKIAEMGISSTHSLPQLSVCSVEREECGGGKECEGCRGGEEGERCGGREGGEECGGGEGGVGYRGGEEGVGYRGGEEGEVCEGGEEGVECGGGEEGEECGGGETARQTVDQYSPLHIHSPVLVIPTAQSLSESSSDRKETVEMIEGASSLRVLDDVNANSVLPFTEIPSPHIHGHESTCNTEPLYKKVPSVSRLAI